MAGGTVGFVEYLRYPNNMRRSAECHVVSSFIIPGLLPLQFIQRSFPLDEEQGLFLAVGCLEILRM
jgi:hypothetical protein